MKNLVLVGLAMLLCAAPCSAGTNVTQISLNILNGSQRCAWVTVYTGRLDHPVGEDQVGLAARREARNG